MSFEQIIGVFFLSLGLTSFLSYFQEKTGVCLYLFYKELKPMQERWGQPVGLFLHFAEYVMTPLAFGLVFLTGLVAF